MFAGILDDLDTTDVVVWVVGWTIGWLLLWRLRPLPDVSTGAARPACAVIVPARNEQGVIADLLRPLVGQLRRGDELVVVDDHSVDATRAIAEQCGAVVIGAPPLADGWLGKPNACWHGAQSTEAPVLVFLDADVRPAPDLLDRLAVQVSNAPTGVVSVQPWHATRRFVEQASILCNVVSLMGSGAFTVGPQRRIPMAFGPVLAIRRSVYDGFGGHASDSIRSMHTEDIAIARAAGGAEVFSGRPDTMFRMYPDGLAQTVRGWTRTIATGARSTPWWLALAVLAWIWSLAGGWISTPLVYPLCVWQVWVLGRRAGSIHPLAALAYPIAVIVLVAIFVCSVVTLVFGREIVWKGRSIQARSG